MILSVHGVAGGWDELIIAVVAFGVLWFAVKLAGRKPAQEDDEEGAASVEAPGENDAQDQDKDAARRRATRLS